jgi:hypothetical protein
MATRSLPRNNPSFYIAGAAVTLALYRARRPGAAFAGPRKDKVPLKRRARGEALVDIARSYAVSHSTISRLA